MKFFSRSLVVIGILFTVIHTQAQERIFHNGKIATMNDTQPFVEAVAISGDKIIAVGKLADVKLKVSSKAEIIDLKGNTLLPGLIDSHNHAISGGESLMLAYLDDQLLDPGQLAAYAVKTLKSRKGMMGDVLYIDGMHSGTWAMLKELHTLFNSEPYLSQPVILRGSDGHTAWVNNVMLKRAGVHSAYIKSLSADEKKYFAFDASFEPNGLVSEDGFNVIQKVLPANSTDFRKAGELGVNHLNSLGITAWMDPSTGTVVEKEDNTELMTYIWLSGQGKLNGHVVAVIVAEPNEDPAPQIALVKKFQSDYRSVKNVSIAGFKIFADGVLEYPTQTAAVSIPYLNSGQSGALMAEPGKFKDFVIAADRENFLVHVHAIGDRAVTEALNSFEAARKMSPGGAIPHSITHLQIVKPSDFRRFKELNVLVCLQLLWATADIYTMDLVKPYLDPALFASQYPARSFMDNGAVICGASDWPVSSANPFAAIYTAETREGKFGVLDAREIMPRQEMIKAYTINAARALMMEKTIGSIEPGKQADFVLVDRDVFTVSPALVKDTHVVWTMFGGKKVFGK